MPRIDDRLKYAQSKVRQNPKDPNEILFLAKTQHSLGMKEAARIGFRHLARLAPTPEMEAASVDLEMQHDDALTKGPRFRWLILLFVALAGMGVCLLAISDPEFRTVADDVFMPPSHGYEVALALLIAVSGLSGLVFMKSLFSGASMRRQAQQWEDSSIEPCRHCGLSFPLVFESCPHCGSGIRDEEESGEGSGWIEKKQAWQSELRQAVWVFGALFAFFLVAFVGIQLFHDPLEASFYEMLDAARHHDLAKFRRYVDINLLMDRAVDQIEDDIASEPEKWAGHPIAKGLSLTTPSNAKRTFVSKFESMIETGQSDFGEMFAFAPGTGHRWKVEETRTEGKIGFVKVRMFHGGYQRELNLYLKMRSDDRVGWRLIEFDATKLIGDLDRIAAEISDERNRPAKQILQQHIKMVQARAEVVTKNWDDIFEIEATFENGGEKDLRAFGGTFSLMDLTGRQIQETPVEPVGPLPVNSRRSFTWALDINMFTDDIEALKSVYEVEFNPTLAVLENGERIELMAY